MHMTATGLPLSVIMIQVANPPLELYTSPKAFRPNPTTVRFARTVRIKEGDIVFDIGTGIGPLAIKAAMDGARHVYGVDPVPMHCELARMNAAKYGMENRISTYDGCLFEPFETESELRGLKADVIIGDVSGIADPVARALGWYSDEVPTGGEDGTDVIIELIRKSTAYLARGGCMYFPIAVDLSDSDKILNAARECYAELVNAMDRPTTQFPMSPQEMQAIENTYGSRRPSYINIQSPESHRPFWRGQIWKASQPR